MKRLYFVPKFLCLTIFFLFAVFCSITSINAQQQEAAFVPPEDAAPPPLTVLSKNEKNQLASEDGIKSRTRLSLELMDTRLKSAEMLAEQSKFQDTINELGGFQALLEDALKFLTRNDNDSSKIDYNFKRLEIGLRQTISRLELIRRGLPFKYGYYVLKLQKFVRDARAKAVEPLFSNSVVPQEKLQSNNKSSIDQ